MKKTNANYPFEDISLPIEERLDDVISRLTPSEKCEQLRYDSPAIERLGISEYNWWNEALHGVGRNGRATVFPQAIAMSSMWDPAFTEKIASVIADEARAKHHEASRKGSHQQYQGLNFWTPNINIFRDPRWGRGQETWGEDPYLTGELGAAFVRGLQGNDPKYIKTAACAKHFAVHSGPEKLRHNFDACPSKKDFRETYLPAFKRLVDEGVEAFMGAYNAVYGEPCCGSKKLLQDILRDEWKFEGHVVSDCWAIVDFHTQYKVTSSAEESAAMALKNGCDLNCGSIYCEALEDALKLKLISEEDLDQALRRMWRTRFKLGLFDPEDCVPYAQTSIDIVNCDAHHQMAFDAAVKSTVLLKNKASTLPLTSSTKNILLMGPLVTSVDAMIGNYFGMSGRISSLLEGFANHTPEETRIDYRMGCMLDRPSPNKAGWPVFEAVKSDAVICAVGLDPNLEGEEGDALQSPHKGDRETIELISDQLNFLKSVHQAIQDKKSNTKIIVVLFGGSPIAIPEVQEFADAILQVWYPGEAGGDAIASILFGKSAPSGQLTLTIPRSTDVLPAYEDYSMQGRTYRYMDEKNILYPFGFGLTYTTFSFENLQTKIKEREVDVSIDISNTGEKNGDTITQLYISGSKSLKDQPTARLARFQRLTLKTKEKQTLNWKLTEKDFETFDQEGLKSFNPGEFIISVGNSAPTRNAKALGAANTLQAQVSIS